MFKIAKHNKSFDGKANRKPRIENAVNMEDWFFGSDV